MTDLTQCKTLKEFLNENEEELVDNLYTITISGRLNFSPIKGKKEFFCNLITKKLF